MIRSFWGPLTCQGTNPVTENPSAGRPSCLLPAAAERCSPEVCWVHGVRGPETPRGEFPWNFPCLVSLQDMCNLPPPEKRYVTNMLEMIIQARCYESFPQLLCLNPLFEFIPFPCLSSYPTATRLQAKPI